MALFSKQESNPLPLKTSKWGQAAIPGMISGVLPSLGAGNFSLNHRGFVAVITPAGYGARFRHGQSLEDILTKR